MQAIRVETTVARDGEITVTGLPFTRGQRVGLTIKPAPSSARAKLPRPTAGDLLSSGLVGMWKDRTDIEDSVSYARLLRNRAQRR